MNDRVIMLQAGNSDERAHDAPADAHPPPRQQHAHQLHGDVGDHDGDYGDYGDYHCVKCGHSPHGIDGIGGRSAAVPATAAAAHAGGAAALSAGNSLSTDIFCGSFYS